VKEKVDMHKGEGRSKGNDNYAETAKLGRRRGKRKKGGGAQRFFSHQRMRGKGNRKTF